MGRPRIVVPFIVLVAGLAGCATVPPPPPYTPNFSFTPLKQGSGAGISVALVGPQFGAKVAPYWSSTEVSGLPAAFGHALNEYLTANGVTVSGPFAKVDDMTFPEKKQADLLLTTEVNLDFSDPNATAERSSWDGSLTYTRTGECKLEGAISFVLWEPLSMQRMWAKEAAFPPLTTDCSATGTEAFVGQTLGNQVAHLVEQAFPKVMQTAEKYFHPDELQLVKKQSLELRQKKVF